MKIEMPPEHQVAFLGVVPAKTIFLRPCAVHVSGLAYPAAQVSYKLPLVAERKTLEPPCKCREELLVRLILHQSFRGKRARH